MGHPSTRHPAPKSATLIAESIPAVERRPRRSKAQLEKGPFRPRWRHARRTASLRRIHRRSLGRFFIIVDEELQKRAKVKNGDVLKLVVEPTDAARTFELAFEQSKVTTQPKKARPDAIER